MSHLSVDQERIKTLSRRGEWVCVATMLLIGAYCLFLVLQPAEVLALLQRGLPGVVTRPATSMHLAAIAVAAVPVLVFLYTLWQTRNLFRLIGGGQFLTEAAQKLVVHLGKLAIALSVLGIISKTLVAMLVTSANPAGEKLLLIEIDSSQISSVIVAVLLFTFALLMKESAAIKVENESII